MEERRIDYDKVRDFWNARAEREGVEDDRSITFFCNEPEALAFRDEREKSLFDEKAGLKPTDAILEAGCGSGRWTPFLAARAREVVAFDFAERLLEVNRRAVSRAGLSNVSYVLSDVLSLDLERRAFDGAVCFGVSLYLRDEDLKPAYAVLGGHLREGGKLYTKEPVTREGRIEKIDEHSEFLGRRYTCVYRPRAQVEAAVERAGFLRDWSLPVYGDDEPLAPGRDGVETWFSRWTWRK